MIIRWSTPIELKVQGGADGKVQGGADGTQKEKEEPMASQRKRLTPPEW